MKSMNERQEVTVTLMPHTVEKIEEIRDVIDEEKGGRGSQGMVIDIAVDEVYRQIVIKEEWWD